MKQGIKIGTHMIIGGAFMLMVSNAFSSMVELLAYSVATMVLGGICCVIRQKELPFWGFIGSHLFLILGGVFCITIAELEGWYVLIWIGFVLYSAVIRLVPQARWLDEPAVVYIVVLVLNYMLVRALGGTVFVQRISILAVLLGFLLYLLYRNLDCMDEFIMLQGFSTKVDEQGIRKLNNRLSFLYTALLGFLLGIFSLFRGEKLWQILSGWIKRGIRYILSFLPTAEQIQPEEKEEIKNSMGNMLQGMAEEQSPSMFMKILGDIMFVVFMILLVAVVVSAIIFAAMYIYRHFYNQQNRVEENKIIESLSYSNDIAKEKKPRFFALYEHNSSGKIRRIYKKTLKRLGAKRISGFSCLVPDEQVKLLREQGTDDETVEKIRDLYEKARYSKDFVTDVEVHYMQRNM